MFFRCGSTMLFHLSQKGQIQSAAWASADVSGHCNLVTLQWVPGAGVLSCPAASALLVAELTPGTGWECTVSSAECGSQPCIWGSCWCWGCWLLAAGKSSKLSFRNVGFQFILMYVLAFLIHVDRNGVLFICTECFLIFFFWVPFLAPFRAVRGFSTWSFSVSQ